MRSVINSLFRTNENSLSLTFLRIALGVIMLPHGMQKLFGWFGGSGVDGTLGFFGQVGIPAWLGWFNIFAESVGGLFLILGLLTRVSAFGISVSMIVAIMLVHLKNGFFAGSGGFEFNLLILAVALVLVVKGGGAYAIDTIFARKLVYKETEKTFRPKEAVTSKY